VACVRGDSRLRYAGISIAAVPASERSTPGATPNLDPRSDGSLVTLTAEGKRRAPRQPAPARGRSGTRRPGDRVGRYTLLEALGRGAMGEVFAARDDELGRDVAIKLLLAPASEGVDLRRRARLLREAQAIAAISHPNVVAVFDVGVDGQDVYIVMERIDGVDLRRWQNAGPRPLPAVLDVMHQAALGLAAAHAAGIVHRDFKPANVMVARDGRARVLDFGLARAGESTGDDAERSDPAAPSITRTGERLGTPAYMSPEQHLGLPTEAASDQFSWAVAMHEAVFGVRPFAGETSAQIGAAVVQDRRVPWPRNHGAPPWLLALLDRALAARLEDRFPSMAALATAIERGRGRGRKRWLGASVAALTVGLAVVLASPRSPSNRGAGCDPADLAPAASLDRDAREQILAAYGEGDDGHAVVERLERASAEIDAARRGTCDAHADGQLSDDALAARLACVADHRRHLDTFARVVGRSGGAALEHAREAIVSLPSASACSEGTAPAMLPDDPLLASQVLELRARLAEATVYRQLGRGETAYSLARDVEAQAQRLDYRPLLAEARLSYGESASSEGDLALAEQLLRDAAWLAESLGHDRVLVEASTELAWLRVVALEHYDEVDSLISAAEAAADRLGDPGYHVILLNVRAAAQGAQGDRAGAIATLREVVASLRREADEDANLPNALHNLGNNLLMHGEIDAATASYTEALAITRRLYGEDHPESHGLRQALADARLMADDFAAAIPAYEEVLRFRERAYGPRDPRLATTLNNLGHAHVELGHAEDGRVALERALALKQAAEAGPASLANTEVMLGRAYADLGRIEDGLVMLGRAAVHRSDVAADQIKAIEVADAIESALARQPADRPLSTGAREVVAAAARRATLAGDGARAARLGALVR
jgi:tetratricopeptide (TPR) repeat protein